MVSIGGDVTQIIYALDAQPQLVARDSTSLRPALATRTPAWAICCNTSDGLACALAITSVGLSARIPSACTSLRPALATRLPDVGYMRQLNAEGILALKPTLVCLADSDNFLRDRLQAVLAADRDNPYPGLGNLLQ
jgi:iron complex transport system substrate-binding protein